MARYDENRSYYKLLVEFYSKYIIGNLSNTSEADSGLKYYPISIQHAGDYNNGARSGRNLFGYYWTSNIIYTIGASCINISSTGFYPTNSISKGVGFPVRRVAKVINKNCL